jgi:hypothetical protein
MLERGEEGELDRPRKCLWYRGGEKHVQQGVTRGDSATSRDAARRSAPDHITITENLIPLKERA